MTWYSSISATESTYQFLIRSISMSNQPRT